MPDHVKKAVIVLAIIFVLALFVSTVVNVSHRSSGTPATQLNSQAAPSQQEITKQAYDQGVKDALRSYDLMLKRPTYGQVLDFLATDNTSELKIPGQLVNCLTYSSTFRDHAISKGLWAYIVIFNWNGGREFPNTAGWHAINAFNTRDKGIVYIEPSTEEIVDLQLGEDYSKELCSTGKWCPLYPMFVIQVGVVR